MIPVSASAPGKVVLCGEYAVLQDAPAVCMAVQRRAIVTVTQNDSASHVLTAPGYRSGQWRFRHSPGGVIWLDEPPSPECFALFERLWSRVLPMPDEYWMLTLDSRPFVDADSRRKLGLGASAAIAVALSAVLGRLAGDDSVATTHAADVHRKYQGGYGSGADIATSLHGGLIEFRRAHRKRPRPLPWPAGLHCRFLWSGQSAGTADKLERLTKRQQRDGSPVDGDVLQQQARLVANHWRNRDCKATLASLRNYAGALRRFDNTYELGIFDAGHAELADTAAALGVVYKPCGAGGGDLGAVFAASRDAVAEFVAEAGKRGIAELKLTLDACGVRYEH